MGNLTSHDLRDVGQERATLVTQKSNMGGGGANINRGRCKK